MIVHSENITISWDTMLSDRTIKQAALSLATRFGRGKSSWSNEDLAKAVLDVSQFDLDALRDLEATVADAIDNELYKELARTIPV